MKHLRSLAGALALGLSVALLSGCVFAVGANPQTRRTPTVGEQLMDLQKARDSGALTPAEYETQKAKLLEGPIAK